MCSMHEIKVFTKSLKFLTTKLFYFFISIRKTVHLLMLRENVFIVDKDTLISTLIKMILDLDLGEIRDDAFLVYHDQSLLNHVLSFIYNSFYIHYSPGESPSTQSNYICIFEHIISDIKII